MGRKFLFRTNIFVCIVIVLGFIATSVISYSSNQNAFKMDVERVSTLTSEGIYHEIDTIFAKPIHISLTMANDYLLKEFLEKESEHLTSDDYTESMKGYLRAYKEKYKYDSVFLVSSATNRYYHYNGLNRILEPAHSVEDVEEKAKGLVSVLHYEFVEETVGLPIAASIGVSISPMGGEDFDTLYKNADQALYQAKENGKNGYVIYR